MIFSENGINTTLRTWRKRFSFVSYKECTISNSEIALSTEKSIFFSFLEQKVQKRTKKN